MYLSVDIQSKRWNLETLKLTILWHKNRWRLSWHQDWDAFTVSDLSLSCFRNRQRCSKCILIAMIIPPQRYVKLISSMYSPYSCYQEWYIYQDSQAEKWGVAWRHVRSRLCHSTLRILYTVLCLGYREFFGDVK